MKQLTVAELIEKLQKLPPDAVVVTSGHSCLDCYGSVMEAGLDEENWSVVILELG